jgi:radical SAM protein with 4Fe4S-binding SPASM domain
MNDVDKTKEIINSISPSFCAAKWYNATVWLSNGRTASCHHPIAHNISVEDVENDPSALHNTEHKKQMRKLMLEGKRPAECSYCWRVEDNGDSDIYSDRIYKSMIYSNKDVKALKDLPFDQNIDPKTLEISFDNLCNLSCTYCNQEFSSTWMNDLKIGGHYMDLKTPGARTYTHSNVSFAGKDDENVYITKFFEWYDRSLKDNLQELRVTGGEPSRSPYFWKLVDKIKDPKFAFAVNSNLIMDAGRLAKLVNCSNKFKKFDLYTSCESYGKHA